MHSLHQFTWVAGTNTYRHAAGELRIADAPSDADLSRWSMLHDGDIYRLYCFKGRSPDTLYQFGFDGHAYRFAHRSIPELKLVEFPDDADPSSFAMLHDGRDYRLFLRRQGDPCTLYQAAWVAGTPSYRFAHRSIASVQVTAFPEDTDWSRWSTLHDGAAYRLYAGKHGEPAQLYQAAFNVDAQAYQHDRSLPVLELRDGPPDLRGLAMLHDGAEYRAYRQR